MRTPASVEAEDKDDGVLTELTRLPAQVAMLGRDRFTFTVLEQDVAVGLGGEAQASANSVDLPRWAAVPIDDDDSSGDEGDTAANSSVLTGNVPVVELEVEVVNAEEAGLTAGGRTILNVADDTATAAKAARGEDDDDSVMRVSYDLLSTGYGKLDAVATSVTDAEEQRILIEIPVGRLIQQQQRAQQQQQREAEERRRLSGLGAVTSAAAAAAGMDAVQQKVEKDTFDRLAERVAQLQVGCKGGLLVISHYSPRHQTLGDLLATHV